MIFEKGKSIVRLRRKAMGLLKVKIARLPNLGDYILRH